MVRKVKRKLTFYAWDDLDGDQPFDRLAAADKLNKLKPKELILEEDGKLYAVAVACPRVREGSHQLPAVSAPQL